MDDFLKLDDASKIYRRGSEEVRAVDGVTLSIPEREFVCIVGPSGSGKSTLLHLLGCMDKPTSGSVVVCGRDIHGLSDRELAGVRSEKIGFVFQQFFLVPTLTALENITLPVLFTDDHRTRDVAKAGALLVRVGLEGRGDHLPSELSGGEMQRVAIARALVNMPELLLADEPTGNLDSRHAAEIAGVLAELNRDGLTVVMVTHNEKLAEQANRIVRISDGKIVDNHRQPA